MFPSLTVVEKHPLRMRGLAARPREFSTAPRSDWHIREPTKMPFTIGTRSISVIAILHPRLTSLIALQETRPRPPVRPRWKTNTATVLG